MLHNKKKADKKTDARFSSLQRFEPKTIHRSQIKNAAYNPRRIKAANRERLHKSLDEFGLVEPLVWNERNRQSRGRPSAAWNISTWPEDPPNLPYRSLVETGSRL